MKMRKLVALVMAVLMLCGIIPFTAVSAENSATIDFTSLSNRTSYSTSQQVWKQNGITVTNDKGASTSNVGDYFNPGRFYKSSTVTIEYPGMTKIVIEGAQASGKDYATPWSDSFSANATATVNGTTVTILLAEPADSFTFEKLSAQARAYSITVYSEGGGSTPEVPDQPDEPDEPETPDTPDMPAEPASSATIDFTDKTNRTSYSTSQQVWQQNGITVTNDKGASTSNVGDYGGDGKPARFYKSSTVTLEYPGMTKIVIEGDAYSGTDYAAPWANSFSADATATVDGTTVTIVLAAAADSFTWEKLSAQARAYNITVYAGEGSDTPDTPDEPEIPDTPDQPDDPQYAALDTTAVYVLGMIQENVSAEDIYFLDGGMDGYYMTTTTELDYALLLYVEQADGGYYLYALDEDGAQLYINMVVSGTHVNGVYESVPSTVYNYDVDLGILVAEINNGIYAFGTRNDREYTTMGPVNVNYNGFHAVLYALAFEDPCEHAYDSVCDDECNLCGEWREVPDHEYSDSYDAACNNCGYIRDLPIYGGAIAVGQNSAHAGENVNLVVQVDNNPGIVSAKVKVHFDNTLLEFVSAVKGNFSETGYSWSDFEVAQEKGYIIINWCDSINSNSVADILATLTFKVKEDAPVGFASVWVEFNCEDDIFNANDKTVYFDAVSGGVEILETVAVLMGDVNGDGKLNNRDLGLLQKFINGFEVSMDEAAADMNGDGKINNRDLGLLQKVLNS